jgi:hypothetical protein
MKLMRMALPFLCLQLAVTPTLLGANLAHIMKSETQWTLENDALKTVVSFSNGSVDMTSFFNKLTANEYLTGPGERQLFKHMVDGEVSHLKNDDPAQTKTISASDILALNFPNHPHTLHYVPDNTLWTSTTGGLADGKRNCLCRYDTGEGWATNPENNFCTSIEPGAHKGRYEHTFLHINAWSAIDNVKVHSDPVAVQLVLFPNEEVEYFAVNLEVFKGDQWDARVAVSEHLRLRYKFNPARFVSINDWQWYAGGTRTDAYYRNTAVPVAIEAGLDRIHVDDYWNGEGNDFIRDSDQPLTNFTTDLPALGSWIESQGLKLGIWFSPIGGQGQGWDAWGRDLADPATIAFKTRQLEDTLIAKYHSYWDQIDLGILFKTDGITSYSHPSDNVYRKGVNLRKYMNSIQHKYPNFIMQTTCEIDNINGSESVSLLHIPDNGIAGLFRRTESHDNVKDMFNVIGMFPLEGMLETYGEDGQDDVWRAKTGWFYEWLLGRHTSIYYHLDTLTPDVRQLCRRFNDWRKSPRIEAVLNEVVRPVYNGPDDDNSGPWAWMFVNEAKTKGILIAVGGANKSAGSFTPRLRWLDPGKTYLVEDITLQDDGTWHYSFKCKTTGAALVQDGLEVNLLENPSRGKAFWIQEVTPNPQQVLYADDKIVAYTENWDDTTLTVNVSGTAGATAQVIVYKTAVNGTEIKSVTLDSEGQGKVRFSGNSITPQSD